VKFIYMDNEDDSGQSQEILVLFWGLLIIILLCVFGVVMYLQLKAERFVKQRLYNFKKAPKNYIDEDSFIR